MSVRTYMVLGVFVVGLGCSTKDEQREPSDPRDGDLGAADGGGTGGRDASVAAVGAGERGDPDAPGSHSMTGTDDSPPDAGGVAMESSNETVDGGTGADGGGNGEGADATTAFTPSEEWVVGFPRGISHVAVDGDRVCVGGSLGNTNRTIPSTDGASRELPAEADSGTDAFLACFDTAGVLQWVVLIHGPGSQHGGPVAFLPNGDLLIAGNNARENLFGQTTGEPVARDDEDGRGPFLARYSRDGELIWALISSGSRTGAANGELAVTDDAIYLGGSIAGTSVLGSAVGDGQAFESDQDWDALLARYSFDGELQWAVRAVAAEPSLAASVVANDSGIYVGGEYRYITDFESTAGEPTKLRSANTYEDGYVARYTPDGALQWVNDVRYSNGYPSWTNVVDIALRPDGSVEAATVGASGNGTVFQNVLGEDVQHDNLLTVSTYSPEGEPTRVLGYSDASPTALAAHGSDLFVAGTTYRPGSFESSDGTAVELGPEDPEDPRDVFLLRYDAARTIQESRVFGGPGGQQPNDAVATDDAVYLVGEIWNTLTYADTTLREPTANVNNPAGFLLRVAR